MLLHCNEITIYALDIFRLTAPMTKSGKQSRQGKVAIPFVMLLCDSQSVITHTMANIYTIKHDTPEMIMMTPHSHFLRSQLGRTMNQKPSICEIDNTVYDVPKKISF